MKAKARMLTGIPTAKQKIAIRSQVMQLISNETEPSATNPTTASNKKPLLDKENNDKAGQEHDNVLQPHYLLTDIEINAACRSMGNKWTDVTLQDCLLIQTKNKFQAASKFCQVLHDSTAQHWIAVSNLNAPKGYTRVFDSLGLRLKKEQLEAVQSKWNVNFIKQQTKKIKNNFRTQ